jgi:outer membrane protein TolC
MSGMRRLVICAVGLTLVAPALPATLLSQQPATQQQQVTPYVVGEALPPAAPGTILLDMTLDEAIATALSSNLDIQTIRLDPRIQSYSLRAARAAFSPTLNANYGYNNSTNQSTSQLDGGERTTSERQTLNTSLAQTMPWYGGRLSANFNNSRTETDNSFSTRNPSYSSSLSLNYTQPLLAGFRIDNQRASLETQEIQGQITDLQVDSRIESITNQVRSAYWSLRATIEQIEIQRRSLAQAELLLAENRLRVRLGRMTEIQVAQAEAQEASASQALLNAEIQWRNQEYAFKVLLVGGPDDELLYRTVNPVSQPTLVERTVDIPAAVDIALRERSDIRQQRFQRDISEVNLEVSSTNTLPTLNLTAGYSLAGVGGDLFDRGELGGDPVLVQRGGYLDGLQSIAGFDTPTWNLSLNASYPLGTNSAKANLERSRLQLQQTELNLRRQELAIVTQVTTAGLTVQNTFLQLEAARRSREAAERTADAELARFGVGVATNYEVTQAQDALTSARLSELRAVINYVNAIAQFELVQRVGG